MALDSPKLNEKTVETKVHVLNMDELISGLCRKVAAGPVEEIWVSKFDIE